MSSEQKQQGAMLLDRWGANDQRPAPWQAAGS